MDNNRCCGFGLCYLYLRNLNKFKSKHKRIYWIHWGLGPNLRIKMHKHLVHNKPDPSVVPLSMNQVWSMDFMHDQQLDCKSIRLFNVIVNFKQEALDIELNFYLPSERVMRSLDQIISWRGKSCIIRADYGPELISGRLTKWTARH